MKNTATAWNFVLLACLWPAAVAVGAPLRPGTPVAEEAVTSTLNRFCLDCHDAESAKGGLDLTALLPDAVERHPEAWEKIVRRLATRQMPPAGKKARPTEAGYESAVAALVTRLDAAAVARPQPGRTETIRRLNRTEYQNAIRDLLALEVDAAALLPAEEASHGFDNVTVGTLSPTLLERYLSAAQKLSRLAVGGAQRVPGGDTIRIRADITQEDRAEGLPFGTRGGAMIPHTFPRDGEYDLALRLARDRNDEVEGLREPHELLVLLDGAPVQSFMVNPPAAGAGHNDIDTHLRFRLRATAGRHELGVTFLKQSASLLETKRQPYESHFNFHRHPRLSPAVYQISVTGPFGADAPGNPESRRRIFVARPRTTAQETPCAKQIIATLLRRAWRRPVSDDDVARIFPFYEAARKEGDFDAGIEAALSAVLVSREFLFRVETEPGGLVENLTERGSGAGVSPVLRGVSPQKLHGRDARQHRPEARATTSPREAERLAAGAAYRIPDVELASRLSFFLWSSIPDDELLGLAERGRLSQPRVLEKQVRRLLADPRAGSLVRNFAGQWLHLRNLDSITPDGRLFPDFDDNLRQAMRRETELLFDEIRREDRSVLDLLRSDHAWLNERLAKHYGIPHVYGSHFRRVALAPGDGRGGLLRHASVLTVTSYATRTSPVLRGKWILENLLGTPPPPPPADVPALDGNAVSESLPVRQRLAAHRDQPACASCHAFIDPPGFALENFDAVGRWRTMEDGRPVDASGGLPDGRTFTGVNGLEDGLVSRPDLFATTLTEKLLTFALGRGVEPSDAPAVRQVVRAAGKADHRFSAIILGIVRSVPFTHRQSL